MYRYIVVGRGMIGSAAGRHLAALADGVAILGPGEPEERVSHDGVFASHYDEGRMCRIVDPDPAWSVTAKRSIERYPDIEARSGIRFFTPSGYLGIEGPGSDFLDRSEQSARINGAEIARLDAPGIRAGFPFLAVADDARGLTETGSAGHVSPRALVEAQTALAAQSGAAVIDDRAVAIRPTAAGIEIVTGAGESLRAEKILVAAGAFTDACRLLPAPLDLTVFGRTVALARLDDDLMAELKDMPTMVQAESGAYILPPIPYPDGNSYVKIGIGTDADQRLGTLDALTRWFKSPGSEEDFRNFRAVITALIPALARCRHWRSDSCAVTETPTGRPYIDYAVKDRVAVAVGGNGKGAKSSDDWGWLAARLMTDGDWDHPVTRDQLRLPIDPTV